MIPLFAIIVVSITLGAAMWPLIGLLRSLAGTTLLPAGFWTLGAAALWALSWTVDHLASTASTSIADHLWYASAVVALCPAISVLGSRRPGTRVWTWFILIPMLGALGWPVITLWLQGSDIRGLQLETPQLVGYLLVIVMGAGNYLGTRYTLSSLLYIVSGSLLVLCMAAVCPAWLSDRWWTRLAATVCVEVAILLPFWSRPADTKSRFDRLWLDFFNQFGIVWGRRIQDRVNFIAAKENWPARLELHGLEWTAPADPATEARIEHTFRWLLRRFVDPEWIDRRLESTGTGDVAPLGADS